MAAITIRSSNAIDSMAKLEEKLSNISTSDEVTQFFENVKTLEKLLKAAKLFNQKVREYATLEAKTYMRIAELGLVDSIPSNNYQRAIAEWFVSLGEKEREDVISLCESTGQTIGILWKKNVKEPELVERSMDYMREQGECAIEIFKEEGIVDIDMWLERCERDKHIPADVFNGYKDTIRNRIRKLNGHSVDERPGVYVSTEYARKHFVDISTAKVESIEKDFARLLNTIEEMRETDFEYKLSVSTKSNFTYELTDKSIIHLAVCLLDGGTPSFESNSDRVKASIIATLIKHLGMSVADIVHDVFVDSETRFSTAEQKCLDILGFTEEEQTYLAQMYRTLYQQDISRVAVSKMIRGY